MPEIYPPTGSAIVDSLRGLQSIVATYEQFDDRIARARQGLRLLEAGRLIGNDLAVTANDIFAESAEGLCRLGATSFFGKVASYGYMFDEDIPIDSLTIDFEADRLLEPPQPIAQPGDQTFEFSNMELQLSRLRVPVLALRVCTDFSEL